MFLIDLDDDAAFPRDPWAIIPIEVKADAAARLALGASRLEEHYSAPRDEVLARDFLIATLRTGRIYLYGAGSMTIRLLDWLDARPEIEIAGVIDRNAATLRRFHDLPVIAPDDLRSDTFDYVLVAHPLHEMDMIATLLAAGVPEKQIFALYDNPGFASMALPQHRARVAAALATTSRHCIVGTSHMTTIPDEVINTLFSAEETTLLYFSPYEKFQPSSVYPTIDLASSTTLLKEALRQLAPEVILLRSTSHIGFLAQIIGTVLPDAFLIHDFYDFTNLLPTSLVHGWLAMSKEQAALSYLAEYHSLQSCDIALSKRSGPWLERVLAPSSKPYICYFPSIVPELEPPDREPKRQNEPWHILYAGILLTPKPGEYAGDYNFLSLFEALAASGRFIFDLYNSAHRDTAQDAGFQHFLARYAAAPVRYRRRVTYPELHAESGTCDFGWLYREPGGEVSYDAATVIPARCLGYINAGLPVILDDKHGYLEELVTRHHAGVVLPQGEGARLAEILGACDLERLRAGAKALLRYCIAHNETAMKQLSRHLRGAGRQQQSISH